MNVEKRGINVKNKKGNHVSGCLKGGEGNSYEKE